MMDWYQSHKFIDPTVCADTLINKDARCRNRQSFDENFTFLINYVKDVFHSAFSDPECWIFIPYNIGYDF